MLDRLLFAAIFFAALTGLFSCTYLRAHTHEHPLIRPYRPAQNWGMVFFGGVLLFNVLSAMGDRVPIPWLRELDLRVALAQLVAGWGVVCLSGMALNAALRTHRHAHDYARESRHWCDGWRKFVARSLLLAALLLLPGCAGGSIDPFVIAEEANYQAIAPDYSALVGQSAQLSPEQKARRLRTVRAWRLSLDEKEGKSNVGPATQPSPGGAVVAPAITPAAGPASRPAVPLGQSWVRGG